jgi:hypothetical protein
MAFITASQARTASRRKWATEMSTKSALRAAASLPMSTSFDVFLSHSFEDADVIGGIKTLIEEEGLSVYVDWATDPQLDRSRVTAATADILRQRMRHCRFLLYASSKASSTSKWMPWELGYFDGFRPNHVGIMPIVQFHSSTFQGQEYLGLYPAYEYLDFKQFGRRLARYTSPETGEQLVAAVRA